MPIAPYIAYSGKNVQDAMRSYRRAKGEAMNWLRDPNHAHLRLRIEIAHAAVEAATVEARRRVRLNEGR